MMAARFSPAARRILTALTALVLATATGMLAQSPGTAVPEPGDRVRVTITGGTTATGVVVALNGESLTWLPDDARPPEPVMVPRAAITALDLSRGRSRNTGKGALTGATVGFVGGAVLGAVTWEPCEGWCIMEFSQGATAMMAGTSLGVLGLALGAAIGAVTVTEKWQSHALAPTLTLAPAGPGRAHVGVEWRFGS